MATLAERSAQVRALKKRMSWVEVACTLGVSTQTVRRWYYGHERGRVVKARYSAADRRAVLDLRARGASGPQIEALTGVPRTTAWYWLRQARATASESQPVEYCGYPVRRLSAVLSLVRHHGGEPLGVFRVHGGFITVAAGSADWHHFCADRAADWVGTYRAGDVELLRDDLNAWARA